MYILYDDVTEFAEVVIRCNDTARKGECSFCPFYDRCVIDSLETRSVLACKITDGSEVQPN